jgi:hypothetical protein
MTEEKSAPKTKEKNLKISKETLKDLNPKGEGPKGGIVGPEYKPLKKTTDG